MIQTVRKAWGIPELRKKILFTLLILVIYRIGSAIPVPYVNVQMLEQYLQGMGTTILGLYNVMSGGAFAQATVFALGIQPYINSSIIIQLLTVAIPALERMQRTGGEAGKEAILPLKGFYDQLESILSTRLNTTAMERYLAVIADNSSKGIYLEDGTLVGHLLPAIDGGLGQSEKLQRRLSL